MGVLFDILLFVVFICVPVAGLCLQNIPKRLDDVRFRDTDQAIAYGLVAQYASGTFEQRFGYPTGYFYVDKKRSQRPSKIVMKELQPAGAVTDGCAAQLGVASLSGFDGGCAAGCMTIFIVAFIAAPFFLISTMDRFFRFLLRSRVEITLRSEGQDTVASFAFYGPGGYALRTRYAHAFARPVLPATLVAPTPDVAGPGAHRATA